MDLADLYSWYIHSAQLELKTRPSSYANGGVKPGHGAKQNQASLGVGGREVPPRLGGDGQGLAGADAAFRRR